MSNSTESPFSFTIKVGPTGDLLTGRADTLEEMLARVDELNTIKAYLGATSNTVAPAATVPNAVQTLAAAGIAATDITGTAAAIEQRTDKWGNVYTKGDPSAGTCSHGPRYVKKGTNKAGRAYTGYVCVNGSPWGDYKQATCDMVFPN